MTFLLGVLMIICLIVMIPAYVIFLYLMCNDIDDVAKPIALVVASIPTFLCGLITSDGKMAWISIVMLIVGIVWWRIYVGEEQDGTLERKRREELEQIEIERKNAIASQNQTEPWAKKYMTSPCPYCGHYKVRWAKWEDKQMSVAFWGGASSKIGTNYKCEHCQRMWE